MKKTALLLALFLACGTVIGCEKNIPVKETTQQEETHEVIDETKAPETDAPETEAPETDVFWEFVHEPLGKEIFTYLKTNADVPTSIEEFREPTVEPEGLIKKVLEKNSNDHLIIHVQSENDGYLDAIYNFWQKAVPPEGEAIARWNDTVYNQTAVTEVNGYDAYWKEDFSIGRGGEPEKEGLSLTWHDDKYYYTIVCADNAVTLDQLVEMAASVVTSQDNTPMETETTEPAETQPAEIEIGEGQNLITFPGTVFSKGPMEFGEGSLEDLFDGKMTTYADYKVDGGEDYCVYITLPAPAVLTNVQMWAPDYEGDGIPNRPHVLYGMIVEGSNDGENWDFILQFGDNYIEYEEYAWDLEDSIADYFDEVPFDGEDEFDNDAMTPASYTHYRIYNDCKGVAVWGDIVLWGIFGEVETAETTKPVPAETDAPETEEPSLNAVVSGEHASFLRDTFHASNDISVQYYLYVPSDYNAEEEYPLTVYLHGNYIREEGELIEEAELLFQNPESPVFGGIVLAPLAPDALPWTVSEIDSLMELTDHINDTYHTDTNRQYYIGSCYGADAIVSMMETNPQRISAAVSAANNNILFVEYDDGKITPVGIPEKMAEIPLCIAYDTTREGTYYSAYSTRLRDTLIEMGAKDVFVTEAYGSTGRGTLSVANEEDSSVIQWLFEQSRPTKKTPDVPADTDETTAPETDAEAETIQFNATEAFEWGEFTASNGITLPYRYFLPENYDESKEYPVLLFLHNNGLQGTGNERPITLLYPFFTNANSPAHESIVVVPQCPRGGWWSGNVIDAVVELLRYINREFSTDLSRQYAMGVSMGGDGTWDLVMRYPELLSGAVPIAGSGFGFTNNDDGTVSPKISNPKSLEVPICHVYDTLDHLFTPTYQRAVNCVLLDLGSETSTYRETSEYGHGITTNYISEEDISVLEWLFAQQKETAYEK